MEQYLILIFILICGLIKIDFQSLKQKPIFKVGFYFVEF